MMTSPLRRAVAGGAVAVLAAATVAALGVARASAATTPAWEPDANSVGGLLFFDAQGHQITGGQISATPIAAYVEATKSVRSGDTNAVLSGYLPVSGQLPSQWNGDVLSGSTAYPNSAAPGTLATTALPVVTGAATDFSIADLESDYPTTSTAGYQNVYQLRLTTTAADTGQNTTYDSADILVDTAAGTWSVEYTKVPLTATKTTLATSAGTLVHGARLTLTATVAPAVAGKVQFLDGTKVLGTVTATAGKATFATTSLAGGTHKLKATFVPTAAQTYAKSSSSVRTVTVSPQTTTTVLKASKTTLKHGTKLTLTATEKPVTAGTVTFYNGTAKLGSVKPKSGIATLATSTLGVGSHKLKATFTPSSAASYTKSTSKTVSVQVTK